jgi:hypothetical protein
MLRNLLDGTHIVIVAQRRPVAAVRREAIPLLTPVSPPSSAARWNIGRSA